MKIVAIGDSYFTGYLTGGYSFLQILQKNYSITNLGRNGATTFEINLIVNNMTEDYDLAIVHIGINDFLRDDSLERVEQQILCFVEAILLHVKRIMFLVPPQLSNLSIECGWSSSLIYQSVVRKQNTYNKFLLSLQNQFAYTVSLYDYFQREAQGKFIDGIHPDKATHEKIARILMEKIEEVEREIEMDKKFV